MKSNMKNLYFFIIFLLILSACGGSRKPDTKKILDKDGKEEKESNSSNPPISKEVLSDIVTSIPSPLEISFLIKDLGIKYDKNILNTTDKSSSYKTDFKQALNLGVYSTDLGYSNIYSQTQDALFFLNGIKKMANSLNVGEFFDFKTIEQLATNSSNLDSLLLVTSLNLEKINEHLQKKDRADLTILILTGGWVEALYITCEVAKKAPNNELLSNRIGEQKIILQQLLLLLSFYEDEYPKIKDLRNSMVELEKIYSNVKITFDYKDSSTKEENGVLIVQDNTTSKISFTAKDLDNIHKKVKEIRDGVIG